MKIISKRSLILSSITTLALVMSVSSHAKIYKWTDAKGQTHYTAQPPAKKQLRSNVENIEAKIRAKAGKYKPPAKTKTEAVETANTGAQKPEKLSGPDKKLISYCESQRNNVKQLRKNFRNVWIDPDGKKTTLNQQQRQEKVAYLEAKIKSDCSEVNPSKPN